MPSLTKSSSDGLWSRMVHAGLLQLIAQEHDAVGGAKATTLFRSILGLGEGVTPAGHQVEAAETLVIDFLDPMQIGKAKGQRQARGDQRLPLDRIIGAQCDRAPVPAATWVPDVPT